MLLREKNKLKRFGQHWSILEELKTDKGIEEDMETLAYEILDHLESETGFGDYGIEEWGDYLMTAATDWLSHRYVVMQASNTYPEDYSFVYEVSVDEARSIKKCMVDLDVNFNDYQRYEDYFNSVTESYAYGGTDQIMINVSNYRMNASTTLYIESAIISCCLELLEEEGWFFQFNQSPLTRGPHEDVW